MTDNFYTTEEKEVTVVKKVRTYTCNECGEKIENSLHKIEVHCAEHRLPQLKKEVKYKEPERVLYKEGKEYKIKFVGSAVFSSEQQADEFCKLLQMTADYYNPTVAEVLDWNGPGKYLYEEHRLGSDFGESLTNVEFSKEK